MKKLPEFRTDEEEIRFWEKHSIADYWEDLGECKDTFKRPKLKSVTLRFDPLILKKLKLLARKRGISYNAYIRYLLARCVKYEMLSNSSRDQHIGL